MAGSGSNQREGLLGAGTGANRRPML